MPGNKQRKNKARRLEKGAAATAAVVDDVKPPASVQAEAGSDSEGGGKADLVFEDPYEDEFEEEEVVEASDNEEEVEDDGEANQKPVSDRDTKADGALAKGMASMDVDDDEDDDGPKKVWRAGVDALEEGEELDFDETAYLMYHSLRPEWPCLSFDIIRDQLGGNRTRFPVTMYAVCGTQADQPSNNKVTLMKMSELHRTSKGKKLDEEDDDDSDDDSDEEALDDPPLLEHVSFTHRGGVNRIRSMPTRPYVVATWADTGHVHLWDVNQHLRHLDNPASVKPSTLTSLKPLHTFSGHRMEGFAMDWSPLQEGKLATGDCASNIHIWQSTPSGWSVDKVAYKGHTASVEDIQWSPSEATVFISCSVDGTVRVWDIREHSKAMLTTKAHDTDVNVCTWNRLVTYLLATGSDDGSFKVWDLRNIQKGQAIAHFKWHRGPITSIEWHGNDESVLAASSADNTVTVWDLSVEEDDESAMAQEEGEEQLPPQLLFVHQGQEDIKELHFHPQVPGLLMTTAADGFNVFKPAIGVL